MALSALEDDMYFSLSKSRITVCLTLGINFSSSQYVGMRYLHPESTA